MKRILIVAPNNRGTIGLCSLNIYKALQKRSDITVKCVIVHKYKNGYAEFEDCEWCVEGVSAGLKKVVASYMQTKWLREIKKEYQPDITISTLFSCTTISVLAGGKDKKIGIFHSPHTQVKGTGWLNYQITLLIYKYIYPWLDCVYCVSNEVKRSIIESFKTISPSKVEVVYNIHDKDNISIKSKEPLSMEEQAVFSKPVILYCGRLDKNKAPDRLLKAFAMQKKKMKDLQLVIIGNDFDGLWGQLEQYTKQAGISDSVHYWGLQANPYKYMKHAQALVSCSYSEGLPGVLIESLLLDTPVIATNSSEGVWEILNCDNDYQPQLKGMYVAGKGIITSNLSCKDRSEYDRDIQALSDAIKQIMIPGTCTAPFFFEEKISAGNVVEKYVQ